MFRPDLLRRFVVLFVLVLFTAPAWGYVVFLKDGTQIITREKYRRDGERVYLILQSGVETFIDASEVDFARTDKLNEENIGMVRVIEGGVDTVVVEEEEPDRQPTLRDLAGGTRLAAPESPEVVRPRQRQLPQTKAGFVDLWSFERQTYANAELTDELSRYLASQGVEGFQIFRGTGERRVLLQMTANSESAVFKGLRDAAAALVQAQTRFPDRIAVLELVMSTESGKRAGQFVLTRELADQLLAGAVDPPTFFYRHVQF